MRFRITYLNRPESNLRLRSEAYFDISAKTQEEAKESAKMWATVKNNIDSLPMVKVLSVESVKKDLT
jgi:hypothetical protein